MRVWTAVVIIPGPCLINLLRQSGQQQQQVRHGKTEQIVIGGRVHVLVSGDHYTRAHVAHDPRGKYQSVDERHGHDDR